jgi:hypothetical protein
LCGSITDVNNGTYTLDWNFTTITPTGYEATFTSDIPVPLPVLGACLALPCLAFGFTRKLRRRAKSLAQSKFLV